MDYASLMKESRGLTNSKGFLVDKSTDVPLGQTEEVPYSGEALKDREIAMLGD